MPAVIKLSTDSIDNKARRNYNSLIYTFNTSQSHRPSSPFLTASSIADFLFTISEPSCDAIVRFLSITGDVH